MKAYLSMPNTVPDSSSINVTSRPFPPCLIRGSQFGQEPCPPLKVLLLPVEKYNFLGISIVGQSNERGDGGIYIGSIMKGGAVAADGRIEPGDMLLQVPLPTLAAGVHREWGNVPSVPSHSSYPPYSVQRLLLGGGKTP